MAPITRGEWSGQAALGLLCALGLMAASCAESNAPSEVPGDADADGNLVFDMNDASATGDTVGTGDGADPDADADGSDTVDGDALVVCVLNQAAPDGTCDITGEIDFGAIAPGETKARLVRLEYSGPVVTYWLASVADPGFTVRALLYSPDLTMEAPQSLPVERAADEWMWFEVSYTGGVDAGPLPADQLVLGVDIGEGAEDVFVPMVGSTLGCGTAFADCDGDPSNGCEVEIATDRVNCGACGNSCDMAGADMACVGGACEFVGCAEGYDNCNDDLVDGCETVIATDLGNCGACGAVCASDNATVECEAGLCKLADCAPGFDDCDGDFSNGCEQDIGTSLDHCGACQQVCEMDNADAFCSAGNCTFFGCVDGFRSCDGNEENGCEVDVRNDVDNCGGCNVTCSNANGSTLCNKEACVPVCNGGFGDCDGDPSNGCEAPLNTAANCGACGTLCEASNGMASCTTGTCEVTGCAPGFGNCNGNDGDGCETPTAFDNANCGGCGVSCSKRARHEPVRERGLHAELLVWLRRLQRRPDRRLRDRCADDR